MPAITLHGCAPVPLAHYLKALGILRLVAESEHGGGTATAVWKENRGTDQEGIPKRAPGKEISP